MLESWKNPEPDEEKEKAHCNHRAASSCPTSVFQPNKGKKETDTQVGERKYQKAPPRRLDWNVLGVYQNE